MVSDIYPNNQPIKVVYQADGSEPGIPDLKMNVVNPAGDPLAVILMTEINNGMYEATFTPTMLGRWWVFVTSVNEPQNGEADSYMVAEVPDVITDGDGVMRTAMDINVIGGVNPSKFSPHVAYDVNFTTLQATDTVLFSYLGEGKLDFFALIGNVAEYQLVLEIDGIDVVRIEPTTIHADFEMLDSSLPIYVEGNDKRFFWNDIHGSDFKTSIKIKANNLGVGGVDIKWLVKYRSKI